MLDDHVDAADHVDDADHDASFWVRDDADRIYDHADRIFDLENKVARLERRLADARKTPARRWRNLCQDEWDMLKEMCCMVAAGERRPEHLIGLCENMDDAIQRMIWHRP